VKKNKFLVHVATEAICLCFILIYVVKCNRTLKSRVQYLEDKIFQCENVLAKHDSLFSKLLQRPVSYQPKPTRHRSPQPSSPPTPPPPTPRHTQPVEVQYSETLLIEDIDYENGMDDEINEELNKLNLIKAVE
jgi:hypothetical protein